MSFVLDSSTALSWCFKDEQSPESLEVLKLARRRAIFVPSLWHVEMANILGSSFRKQRLNEIDLKIALRMFAVLELHTDTVYPHISSSVLMPLMQAYSLTAYDAVYLELALRLNLPLATLDANLAAASRQAGITLL
ncbi:type II toxin-antitoxin system VapC family toxin [Paracidobacterium acidisoli]|uniref:PIN domain-containing protein n=1 Tax=Paracidobacterium acidisoli TaxID=2303751 RepID=A0A372IJ65_9BACT|nr:type II toxin-antitoxin system VapC family toxin [Paracidobacterium acidisoli]MBT9333186.1 type II toxin-antitoxin system VapC family toxin [Paracidobacterium acidisoli]